MTLCFFSPSNGVYSGKILDMVSYQRLSQLAERFFTRSFIFKYGFNWSPMYSRSSGKVTFVSVDLHRIEVKLPLSYRNRNYVNTIIGGSLFASVDPVPMVQLINIIGQDYVVWDKKAEIRFLRPGQNTLYAEFTYSSEEVTTIKKEVAEKNEIEIIKTTQLIDRTTNAVCCEVDKTIYIAEKSFFKEKRRKKAKKKLL